MNRLNLFTVIALLCFLTAPTFAQTSGKLMPFQGNFFENGERVTGTRTFTFTIELGTDDWTETQADVQIVEGLYSVILGSVNPIPNNIFFDAESRVLTVAVGNTTLGSTQIFAPFALSDGQNFGEGIFELETKSGADSIALRGEIYGIGNGEDFAAGVRGLARTDTTSNTGVSGVAEGGATNKAFNTGVRGDAYASTSQAWATGVWGVGNGNGGGTTYGVRGEARGSEIGFSAAMRGLNFVESGTDGFRYGGFFNTYESANSPLSGQSIGVRGNGGGSVRNTGVIGEGYGGGDVNIGIYGIASGATENYSGWFDGGQFILNNVSQLNFWGDNPYLTFKVSGRGDEGWPTDQSGHGQISIDGPNGANMYFGAKVWEDGGADRPVLQMFGSPVQDPNDTENTYNPEAIFMSVNDFGDGIEQGMLQLGKVGESSAILNRDNLMSLSGLVDGNGKYRFEVNEQNSGVLKLMSAVDSVNVLIDSNGEKAGLIHLNDSLGRYNMRLMSYSSGAAYMEHSAGFANIGENRVSAQYWGGQTPYINLIGRDDDGNAIGRAQVITSDFSRFVITDPNSRALATMQGNNIEGGSIYLEGPDAPLIHMSSQSWESNDGTNRARISMFGNDTESDGNGGTYTPERVHLIVSKDDAGTEFGTLYLSNSAGGGFEAGSRSWENDNQGGTRSYTALKGTQDVSDGNGGTYRPWLIAQEIFEDNGQEYGAINISSVAGGAISLNGTGGGDFTGDINANAFNQNSDRRLKKNITTLTSGLATVQQLRGVRYNWKDKSKPEGKIGFIAQEVEQVLPELVVTKENGFKAVNYAELTAVLVEAVKELSAQVESLKTENSDLKAEASRITEMEERLANIEALLLSRTETTNADQK